MRFTFPQTNDAHIVLDTNDGGTVQIYPGTHTIIGTNWHTVDGTARNFAVYFVAVFDRPFTAHGTWDVSGATDEAEICAGKHFGAYVTFKTTPNEPVTVRVGTSLISSEQAMRNLRAESPEADFEKTASAARAEWERELGRIGVSHSLTVVIP